jgi:hypothetical protein
MIHAARAMQAMSENRMPTHGVRAVEGRQLASELTAVGRAHVAQI